MNGTHEWLVLHPEVARALASARPVVALETTVVTHGLPAPEGVETARRLEAEVRAAGAVPATIGVLGGNVHVGMEPDALGALASARDVRKLNLSNLAAALADGADGSTTVAATMWAAHRAGIDVFATGGIGGVHRDEPDAGDVSADLTAFARWPVAVVCAGAKAILDLPRTRERLETLGVPVLGWRTDTFPAFWRRSSGLPVDARFDDMARLATAVRLHRETGLATGVVIGNPIPQEDELPEALYESALAGALAAARAAGVRGRAVTPFLLEAMRERTGAASLSANLALLVHNAQVAAALARALAHHR